MTTTGVRFQLQVQVAVPRTPLAFGALEQHETVTVGRLEVIGLETERENGGDIVVFDSMRVTDRIAPSDDPILHFRTHAYSVSVEQRSGVARGESTWLAFHGRRQSIPPASRLSFA